MVGCRSIEARYLALRVSFFQPAHSAKRQAGCRRQIGLSGTAPKTLLKLGFGGLDATPLLTSIDRRVDLSGAAAIDRVTNPPAGIGREAAAAPPVKPIDRDD